VATIPIAEQPRGIAVNPNGDFVYVAEFGSGGITVIRTSDNTIVTALNFANFGTNSVAVTPDGAFVYSAQTFVDQVNVLMTSDNTVVTNINVGDSPIGLDITPDGQFVYVANASSDTVSVIRTSDNTVVDTINLPPGTTPVNAYDGPIFKKPIDHRLGEIVLRDQRFYYCDLLAP
jgi:YVTN family beta-propeller protein